MVVKRGPDSWSTSYSHFNNLLVALYNYNLDTPLYYLTDKKMSDLSVYQIEFPGDEGKPNDLYSYITLSTGNPLKGAQRQIGDFRGVHFFTGAKTGASSIGSGVVWGSNVAFANQIVGTAAQYKGTFQILGRGAKDVISLAKVTTVTSFPSSAAGSIKYTASAAKASLLKTGVKIKPFLSFKHPITIASIAGGAVIGFLLSTSAGWCDRPIDSSIVFDEDGVVTPNSERYEVMYQAGLFDTSAISKVKGYHDGFVQKSENAAKIVQDLNSGDDTIEQAVSRGWVSLINGCRYDT